MVFNQDSKVLYAHYRKSDNQIFYIGYGTPTRPYDKDKRNVHWQRVVDKHGYYVKILQENLTEEQAKELEIKTIAFYGRKNKKEGPLVNMTEGGSGQSSKDCVFYDHTIYRFKKGDIIEECTQWEFKQKYPELNQVSVSYLTVGRAKTCKGWVCLNPKKEFISQAKPLPIFKWEHKDGTTLECTRVELIEKYKLHPGHISDLTKGKQKSCKGWKCLNPMK